MLPRFLSLPPSLFSHCANVQQIGDIGLLSFISPSPLFFGGAWRASGKEAKKRGEGARGRVLFVASKGVRKKVSFISSWKGQTHRGGGGKTEKWFSKNAPVLMTSCKVIIMLMRLLENLKYYEDKKKYFYLYYYTAFLLKLFRDLSFRPSLTE